MNKWNNNNHCIFSYKKKRMKSPILIECTVSVFEGVRYIYRKERTTEEYMNVIV